MYWYNFTTQLKSGNSLLTESRLQNRTLTSDAYGVHLGGRRGARRQLSIIRERIHPVETRAYRSFPTSAILNLMTNVTEAEFHCWYSQITHAPDEHRMILEFVEYTTRNKVQNMFKGNDSILNTEIFSYRISEDAIMAYDGFASINIICEDKSDIRL